MISTDQKKTPLGLYVLSSLILLSILGVLYSAITTTNYFYIAIVLVPLFVYMGIGIIKRWAGAKELVMVVAVLLFLGAIPDIVVAILAENTRDLTDTINILESIVQFAIFPTVYFYFRREDVKSYFEPAI